MQLAEAVRSKASGGRGPNLRQIEQHGWPSMEELLKAMTCAIALAKHRTQREAARGVGVSLSTLQRRMERYGLK